MKCTRKIVSTKNFIMSRLKYLSYINEYKVILDFIFLRLKTLENLPSVQTSLSPVN
jgi:hypothetical protein